MPRGRRFPRRDESINGRFNRPKRLDTDQQEAIGGARGEASLRAEWPIPASLFHTQLILSSAATIGSRDATKRSFLSLRSSSASASPSHNHSANGLCSDSSPARGNALSATPVRKSIDRKATSVSEANRAIIGFEITADHPHLQGSVKMRHCHRPGSCESGPTRPSPLRVRRVLLPHFDEQPGNRSETVFKSADDLFEFRLVEIECQKTLKPVFLDI